MNISRLKSALLLVLFLGLFSDLYAISGFEKKKMIITNIQTDIVGITQRAFLLNKIDLEEGIEFDDYETAVIFMDGKIQDLQNLKVFERSEYTLIEDSSDDSNIYYTLTIFIEDSNNYFVVPYPKYESSTGFRVGVKTYLYNMFGTLVDFKLGTSINIDKNDAKDSWEVPVWTISPSISGINIWGLDFNLSFLQQFDTSKEYENNGELLQEYTWHQSQIILESKLSLPGHFYYSFGPYLTFNYGVKELKTDSNNNILPNYGDKIEKELLNLTWNHGLGYDEINWIGNFREGFAAEVTNLLTISSDIERNISYSSALGSKFMYFWIINDYFNFSAQISDFYSSIERDTSILLRGVNEGYISGISGIFLNLDMNICIFDWDSVWEIQLRPFFDIGIVDKEFQKFDVESDLGYTTGADVVLYLDKWKSLQMRGTIGIDLAHFEWNDSNKYEVQISGDLSY